MLTGKSALLVCVSSIAALGFAVSKTGSQPVQASGTVMTDEFTISPGVQVYAPEPPPASTVNPKPFIDSSLNITIDNTCKGHQIIQLERALGELSHLSKDAIDLLLKSSESDLNKLYWGDVKKADLSTPVGVFHQVLEGSKKGVTIQCGDELDKCKVDKVVLEGGYVDKDKGTINLCQGNFSGKTKRRFIEDICQDDWTLSDSQPTLFWSAALLRLFITANNLLHCAAWAYPNVLNVARLDPVASAHNIDSYLYFLLDNFAQKHIDGGCRGSQNTSLIKEKNKSNSTKS